VFISGFIAVVGYAQADEAVVAEPVAVPAPVEPVQPVQPVVEKPTVSVKVEVPAQPAAPQKPHISYSDIVSQLDYDLIEEEILTELKTKINKVDVSAIVQKRVGEHLGELTWDQQIKSELEHTVDE